MILAREAGREGGEAIKAFKEGARNQDLPQAVEGFKEAAKKEKLLGQQEYRNTMAKVSKTEALNTGPIWNALGEVDQRFGRGTWLSRNKPSAVSKQTEAVRQQLNDVVKNHTNLMATGDPVWRSPMGFDDLRREVDAIRRTTKAGTEEYAAASVVRDAIQKEIKTNSPEYAKAMSGYHAMSDALKAYEKELSLGSTPDTALRKLLSGLRNNVVANFGRRRNLMKYLAERHPEARMAMYRLAGSSLSSWTPRGLVGQMKMGLAPFLGPTAEIAAISHGVNPFLVPAAIAMQSPKLMGKLALKTGQAGRTLSHVPWRGISPFLTQYGHQSPFSAMDATPFLLPIQNATTGEE